MAVGAEKLLKMANQIAANITISKDPDVISAKLADHLQRFWDPRMRAEIVEYASSHPSELEPVVLAAVGELETPD